MFVLYRYSKNRRFKASVTKGGNNFFALSIIDINIHVFSEGAAGMMALGITILFARRRHRRLNPWHRHHDGQHHHVFRLTNFGRAVPADLFHNYATRSLTSMALSILVSSNRIRFDVHPYRDFLAPPTIILGADGNNRKNTTKFHIEIYPSAEAPSGVTPPEERSG